MFTKFIYFLIFILALVAFIGSPLFSKTILGLNTLFTNASGALSGVIAPEALIILPLISIVVATAFISIWRE